MRRLAVAAALVALALATPAGALALPLVAIDPGHGGKDTGARGVLPPGTFTGLPPRFDRDGRTMIYEKDVTLDVGQRLNAWLQARGFPTVMTRTKDLAGGDRPSTTTLADLKARTDLANRVGAQIFVSIHENALNKRTAGTETYRYYYSDPLARSLAVLIHQQVLARLGLPDRGVRTAGFYVLRHSLMPAVLVEGAFIDNPQEALLLADSNERQALAEALGTGIVRYVQLGGRAAYGPQAAGLTTKYWVTAGAFAKRGDALRRARLVQRRGFEAVVRSRYAPRFRRSLWYVVSGRFAFLDNARSLRDRLRGRGLRANVGPAPAPKT